MENKTFSKYADFYDSLYKEKDYAQECQFLKQVFETYGKNIKTVLDLGCGTGSHALILSEMGYQVTGVDRSEDMLEIARRKAATQGKPIVFESGDIRRLELKQKFDAAIAMFAVMSYQTTNQDVENAFSSVHRHLNPRGIFVFDVWFGPAVLTEKPGDRLKAIGQGGKRILRYAHPITDVNKHTVEVNYTVLEIENDKTTAEIRESHLMRFFFYQELLYFAEKNGFEVLKICPFLQMDSDVNTSDWNISVVYRMSQ